MFDTQAAKSFMEYPEIEIEEGVFQKISEAIALIKKISKENIGIRLIKDSNEKEPFRLCVYRKNDYKPATTYNTSLVKEAAKPTVAPASAINPVTIQTKSTVASPANQQSLNRSWADDEDGYWKSAGYGYQGSYYGSSSYVNYINILEEARAASAEKAIESFFCKVVKDLAKDKKFKEKEFSKIERELAILTYLHNKILGLPQEKFNEPLLEVEFENVT